MSEEREKEEDTRSQHALVSFDEFRLALRREEGPSDEHLSDDTSE